MEVDLERQIIPNHISPVSDNHHFICLNDLFFEKICGLYVSSCANLEKRENKTTHQNHVVGLIMLFFLKIK